MPNEICKCGHFREKHANWALSAKGLVMYCTGCCPTDFDEHIHVFVADNLAYLEWKDEENER